MKILRQTVSLMLVIALFVSCKENGTSSDSDGSLPNLTAPGSQNVVVGNSIELTFNLSADAGYASVSVDGVNGDVSISSEPAANATSGNIVVSFTGTSVGGGSVELTVTDQDGNTDTVTVIISISDAYMVTSNITTDTTWETGNTYILGGRIYVEAGATLTIEEGVVVKGEAGASANSTALVVARDATLLANGSANLPIIFTSVADEITPEMVAGGNFASPNLDPDVQGLWGGVIVLGNAHISVSGGAVEAQIEGIPSSETLARYGGTDDSDSSGSISYVSIRHGGTNIGEGNEINGLSLGGVGSGTTISNIEIVANQDDGIEWFGGAVAVTNVLVWNNGDDGLDTDQAWAGSVSNSVLVNPGGSAFELDGPEGTYTSSGHSISDVSVYMGGSDGNLVDVDDNTDVNMSDILFLGLPVDTDGNATTSFSSDYADYTTQGGFAITSLEAILPTTYLDENDVVQPASLSLSDYFPQSLIDDTEVSEVSSVANATVGADVSVFSWTWASQSGALSDIGLE